MSASFVLDPQHPPVRVRVVLFRAALHLVHGADEAVETDDAGTPPVGARPCQMREAWCVAASATSRCATIRDSVAGFCVRWPSERLVVKKRVASIGIGRKAVSQQTAAHARPVCSARKAVCAGYPLGIGFRPARGRKVDGVALSRFQLDWSRGSRPSDCRP